MTQPPDEGRTAAGCTMGLGVSTINYVVANKARFRDLAWPFFCRRQSASATFASPSGRALGSPRWPPRAHLLGDGRRVTWGKARKWASRPPSRCSASVTEPSPRPSVGMARCSWSSTLSLNSASARSRRGIVTPRGTAVDCLTPRSIEFNVSPHPRPN